MRTLTVAAAAWLAAGCDQGAAPAADPPAAPSPMPNTEELSRRAIESRERQKQIIDKDREELRDLIDRKTATPTDPPTTRRD